MSSAVGCDFVININFEISGALVALLYSVNNTIYIFI